MTAEPGQAIPPQYLLSPAAAPPRTLIDVLYDTANRYPDAPAIDDGEVQLTYAELISDVEDSVAWLAARGIGRGDRDRHPDGLGQLRALHGDPGRRLATGAAYVPVDADDPEERAALVFGEAAGGGDHHRRRVWYAARAPRAAGAPRHR